jgi:peptidoglycan hydrolase CwlO-like protein
MDLKRLTNRAKNLVDKRGGTDALKDDLSELKDIAKGKGSMSDKAKAAAAALKDPGKKDEPAAGASAAPAAAADEAKPTTPAADPPA